MWQKAEKSFSQRLLLSSPTHFSQRTQSCHDKAFKAPETWRNQLMFILKMCILWFMNQAHEPQMGKLREMWFGGHQGDSSRVSSKGSKVDIWLGVVQSALGNSDSSCSIIKIISLKHALIQSAKVNQHSMLNQKPSYYCPEQQQPSKVELTTLS